MFLIYLYDFEDVKFSVNNITLGILLPGDGRIREGIRALILTPIRSVDVVYPCIYANCLSQSNIVP